MRNFGHEQGEKALCSGIVLLSSVNFTGIEN